MKSTSNSSEASSSVLGSSCSVGVDTLPGRSDGVETSGKCIRLELGHVEDRVDARHPRRETIQQICVGAPASTNSGRDPAIWTQACACCAAAGGFWYAT